MGGKFYSHVRKEWVEVSRSYSEDGFLYLSGDPEMWIQSTPADRLSSVRRLELDLFDYIDVAVGDSIGELSELTYLCIKGGLFPNNLKFLPNAISRLHKLQQLEFCYYLEELPANLGDLQSLTSLSLHCCRSLKFLPDSVAKLSKLTSLRVINCDDLKELPANLGDLQCLASVSLHRCSSLKFLPDSVAKLSKLTFLCVSGCTKLEELPANLGDLQSLIHLALSGCGCLKSLPWSIAKLSKLRCLTLPTGFRLYTLPPDLDDSLLIFVEWTHIRKTWKELKSEMELMSLPFPLIPVDAAPFPSTPGYLCLKGDPAPWIERNYNLLSSVRLLDLDLKDNRIEGNVPLSLEKLPELAHLHISDEFCDFDRGIKFLSNSLGKLSNLVSLHLIISNFDRDDQLLACMHLPVNLRYLSLSLSSFDWEEWQLPDSYMPIIRNLSNVKTLDLCGFCDLDLLPLNLHLSKLILRNSTIKSLPKGLQHLEIMHFKAYCKSQRSEGLSKCLNQLVNLETLSYTCYKAKFLPSITSLPNLQELHLKDCFNLKRLPSNLDKLVKLGTLNVSGTRIKSLPNSITKRHKHSLRRLILPKCFKQERLPQCFRKVVMISVDDTPEQYYMDQGYYAPQYEKVDRVTSSTMEGVNEVVVKESTTENIIEKQAQPIPLDHLPDIIQISEGSYFPGRTDPISNDSPRASSNVQNHEMEILPTGNTIQFHAPIELEVGENSPLALSSSRDCVEVVDDVVVKESTAENIIEKQVQHRPLGHLPDAIQISEVGSCFPGKAIPISNNNHHACSNSQNHEMDILPTGNVDGNTRQVHAPTELEDSHFNGRINAVGDNSHNINTVALESEQHKNPQSGKVKNKTQKIEITRESIELCLNQNMKLTDAAAQLRVSRSTMKRALKEYGITWPSNKKRKHPDPSKPAGHGHVAEHLDGTNRLTLSDHVPSGSNGINASTSDAAIRTVKELCMSTQCHMDGHRHVEEYSNGVKECALRNSEQPSGSSSTFVVKAAYGKLVVRFDFSLSSGIEQLQEEVGKRLELKAGKFRMYYEDDEKESILMTCISDLEHALRLSKSSGSNVVRLSIELKE